MRENGEKAWVLSAEIMRYHGVLSSLRPISVMKLLSISCKQYFQDKNGGSHPLIVPCFVAGMQRQLNEEDSA